MHGIAVRYVIALDRGAFARLCKKITRGLSPVPSLVIERGEQEKNETPTKKVVARYFILENKIIIFPWKFFPENLENTHSITEAMHASLAHELGHFLAYKSPLLYPKALLHKIASCLQVRPVHFFFLLLFSGTLPGIFCLFFTPKLWGLALLIFNLGVMILFLGKYCAFCFNLLHTIIEWCADTLGESLLKKYRQEFSEIISVTEQ